MVGSRVHNVAAAPLDHREDGLDLPPLAVAAVVQVAFHLSSVAAGRLFARWSTVRWVDQRLHAELVTRQLVGRLAVEPRVGGDRSWLGRLAGVGEQRGEVAMIRERPLARADGEDEVALHIDRQTELWEPAVDDLPLSPSFPRGLPPAREVAAGVARLAPSLETQGSCRSRPAWDAA